MGDPDISERGKRSQREVLEAIFGECLNYKSGLRIFILAPEVPFFVVQKQALLPKVPIFETFPNFGLYDFYFINLSLLGAILAKF